MLSPHSTIIVNRLAQLAQERPDDTAFVFVQNRHLQDEVLTYSEVWNRARSVARILVEQGCQLGDRAILMYPSGLSYITAFFGCLVAGVIAVPVYPPASEQHLGRFRKIIDDCRPAVILTEGMESKRLERVSEELTNSDLKFCDTGSLSLHLSELSGVLSPTSVGDVAFLQYTSGSTGQPKGVIVTHGNLIENQKLISQAFSGDQVGVVLGWLPLYHDMGLIGCVIQSVFWGSPYVFMSPLTFMQHPVVWLQAIAKYRAMRSGGPNFAYELCVNKIRDEQMEGLDLSEWRIAFCGSEQIRLTSLQRFAERFASVGFDAQSFLPCYGLAEATLFVSGSQLSGSLKLHSPQPDSCIDATQVRQTFVGCGKVPADLDVRIVDPSSHIELPEGQVGEVWVHGASVAQGYWQRPEQTSSTFDARIKGCEVNRGYLRTGDLGFLRGDELVIAGRLKEVLIVGGRNIYPQDIETLAEAQDSALRAGHTAAVMIDNDGTDGIAIVAEIDRARRNKVDWSELAGRIVGAVVTTHGVAPRRVVFLPPGAQIKTSSGKLRRTEIGRLLAAGSLPSLFSWPNNEVCNVQRNDQMTGGQV